MKIKFRAWDKRERKMLSPEEIERSNYALGSHGIMVAHQQNTEHLINLDHFLQPLLFTGVFDRNGNEIYEGDILRQIVELPFDGYLGVVRYGPDHKSDALQSSFYIDDRPFGTGHAFNLRGNDWRVVSNIYENTDLEMVFPVNPI